MPHGRIAVTQSIFRESREDDLPAIRRVEERAYGRTGEAELAATLIAANIETLSLVAERNGKIVGHVLFSRLEGPDTSLALAPLAVDPDFRDMHIGTELVRHGLDLARRRGFTSVFVFGQPDYYCRFGFRSKLADPAAVDWQGPRFLALELETGALAGWSGPLAYPEAFSELA